MNELLILTTGLVAGFLLHWLSSLLWQKQLKNGEQAVLESSLEDMKQETTPVEKITVDDISLSESKYNSSCQASPKAYDASVLIQHAARQDSFFNMVLGFIPCQVFIKDPLDGFRYKIANRNFIEYYQLKEQEVLEHTDEDIFEPDVAKQLRRHDTEVCSNPGKVFRFDEDISYQRDGREVFKSLKICFETADHHPYMLGICVDITDLSHMLQKERINNEALSQAVAESDFRKVVEKCAQTLVSELNCSRVIFLTYTPEEQLKLFHEECATGVSSIKESGLKNHEKLWNEHLTQLNNNELIFYENLSEYLKLRNFLHHYSDYPIHSLAAVPIFLGDKLLGGLLISYCEHHKFLDTDKDLLRSMSKIVSLAALRDRQSRYMRQAEEENQALLDNISIPLWLYDADGCIIQTNRAANRILGVPDNKIPFSCRKLLNCEDKNITCPVNKVLHKGITDHERCKHHDRDYMVESNPIQDAQTGALHGVVSSFYDVTELDAAISIRQAVNDCLINLVCENDMRKAITKSIRDICEQLKATRCYIIQYNTAEKTVSCFLEYTKEQTYIVNQIQNHPYSTLLNWEQRFMENPLLSFPDQVSLLSEKGLESYHKSFVQHDIQSIYANRILLDGKLWGYLSAAYEHVPHELTTSEKDFLGSIAYCIELMLIRQQYQDKIMDALRRAESADKAKSMFLASMSHEIRTPLNAVIGFSELLKDGGLPKQTEADYLKAISDAGNALLALINDVLDLSKLEVGQMVFTPTKVDFHLLVQEVSNIFLQRCQEKKLCLRSIFSENIPFVWIDRLRVRQILFNLIGNAVKFTDSGAITVKVCFERASNQSGILRFSVTDTGIGISEEDQKRIFQMFIQAKALRGTQTERNGTGLGLAICKHMIEKMNGELSLKSTLGIGSEFTVSLCDIPWTERKNVEPVPSAAESEQVSLELRNILVVDDVAMNLKVLTALLNKLGQNVLIANSAKEAWSILEKHSVDLILTDLWMPGMSGAELATKIRQSKKYPHLAIAAVTADLEGSDNFDMSVFDMILTKPVTVDKLRFFIKKFSTKIQPYKEDETD